MNNWNASNSNFYGQIMDSLASFFGLKSEDTTEAELHQKLTDAQTQASLAEKAKQDGLAAAATEVAELKAQIATLTAEKENAEEDKTTAETALTDVQATADKLQEDLTAANTALAAKVKESNTLAAEVAKLIAKKAPAGVDANDDDPQFDKAPAGSGRVVKVDGLFDGITKN